MSELPPQPATFSYRARAADGQSVAGTIEATSADEARQRLAGMALIVETLAPASAPKSATPLRGADFLAFNQQLTTLTAAGMPLEHGLRMIASDFQRGPLRRAIDAVAADLESGKSLPQAINAHRGHFPPLYGKLVDAGIRGGNLSGILLNLNRHLALMRRLQSALWRVFAYPAAVLLIFIPVYLIVLHTMLPQYFALVSGYEGRMHSFGFWRRTDQENNVWFEITQALLNALGPLASQSGWVIGGGILAIVLLVFIAIKLISTRTNLSERLLLATPLIGSIARDNLIARWCDAVGLGVSAGIDLPGAVTLADEAIASPALHRDSDAIVAALSSGKSAAEAARLQIVPPMTSASIDMASHRGDLAATLRSLSVMYQQQAEARLAAAPAILTPIVLLVIGAGVALLALAVIAPLLSLMQSLWLWW